MSARDPQNNIATSINEANWAEYTHYSGSIHFPGLFTQLYSAKRDMPPASVAPRGLSRGQAAAYLCVSPGTFDRLVRDRLMPRPARIYGRVVW